MEGLKLSYFGFDKKTIDKIIFSFSQKNGFIRSLVNLKEGRISEDIRKEMFYDNIFENDDDLYPSLLTGLIFTNWFNFK